MPKGSVGNLRPIGLPPPLWLKSTSGIVIRDAHKLHCDAVRQCRHKSPRLLLDGRLIGADQESEAHNHDFIPAHSYSPWKSLQAFNFLSFCSQKYRHEFEESVTVFFMIFSLGLDFLVQLMNRKSFGCDNMFLVRYNQPGQ